MGLASRLRCVRDTVGGSGGSQKELGQSPPKTACNKNKKKEEENERKNEKKMYLEIKMRLRLDL